MNDTPNVLAGYVKATADELRVAVRYDHFGRVVTFQTSRQELEERGPWTFAFDYLVNLARLGRGMCIAKEAPEWGQPEWGLTTAELARTVYIATEAFERIDADAALSAALRGVR